jgi:hypothetical protein
LAHVSPKNLMRPDNHKHPYRDKRSLSCCDAGDTVQTQYRVEMGDGPYPEDSWFALIEGKWERIPPDKIVPDYAPDGRPYLSYWPARFSASCALGADCERGLTSIWSTPFWF